MSNASPITHYRHSQLQGLALLQSESVIIVDKREGYSFPTNSKPRAKVEASTGRESRCVVVNDDHLFPDAVTPSKVDVNLCETYDVPYMDDDCFILDECWYITDDSRLTCLRGGE
ncbi:hypothetical protein BOX15_Mlig021413g2 [Macrostomum lignano]|uniref:Uncharacterized protein n=1 Tax=Macrostomum lignano TaxID=282301 RepID=A0A267FX09_9PLAT|nr:hypothetical protein BOX15_Mlig021413g2 [Macrostomum lignano]